MFDNFDCMQLTHCNVDKVNGAIGEDTSGMSPTQKEIKNVEDISSFSCKSYKVMQHT